MPGTDEGGTESTGEPGPDPQRRAGVSRATPSIAARPGSRHVTAMAEKGLALPIPTSPTGYRTAVPCG